jgi:hypothetical protein
MKKKFVATFILSKDFADVKVAKLLWRYLDSTMVSPLTYGAVENSKNLFKADSFKAAAELYENEGMLFVRCTKGKLICMLDRQPKHIAFWTFYIDGEEMAGLESDEWLKWFFGLARHFEPIFGFGCDSIEYEAKHRTVRNLPNNKQVRGTVGNTYRDFLNYLPGLYWINFFGIELVKYFGEKILMNLPETFGIRIADNLVAVRLNAPYFPDNLEERLLAETRISDILGPEFFFDKNRTDIHFRLVPALEQVLQKPT